jgi:chorismate synthase
MKAPTAQSCALPASCAAKKNKKKNLIARTTAKQVNVGAILKKMLRNPPALTQGWHVQH